MRKGIHVGTLILLLFCQGCMYFYHDGEKTVLLSFLKDVDADKIVAEPNSIELVKYSGDSENIKAITPYGIVETNNED